MVRGWAVGRDGAGGRGGRLDENVWGDRTVGRYGTGWSDGTGQGGRTSHNRTGQNGSVGWYGAGRSDGMGQADVAGQSDENVWGNGTAGWYRTGRSDGKAVDKEAGQGGVIGQDRTVGQLSTIYTSKTDLEQVWTNFHS